MSPGRSGWLLDPTEAKIAVVVMLAWTIGEGFVLLMAALQNIPRELHESATTLHSDAYCLSAASGNKSAAWEFIEYAIGLEGQQITARLGRTVPSMNDVATSPAFLDPGQAPANRKLFLELAPKLKLLPILAEWPAIERFMNEEIEAAFFGTRSFDEAVETANRKTNEQLKR